MLPEYVNRTTIFVSKIFLYQELGSILLNLGSDINNGQADLTRAHA